MNDYCNFRKLIVPQFLPILFYIGAAYCVYSAIILFTYGGRGILPGIITIVVGIPLVRLICESFLLLARIADAVAKPCEETSKETPTE